jgi:hypothetical protein
MSENKINHIINVPDCTVGLFITYDENGYIIGVSDFFSPPMQNTECHRVLTDMVDSMLPIVANILDFVVEKYVEGNQELTEEDKENLKNVIYVDFKKPTKH